MSPLTSNPAHQGKCPACHSIGGEVIRSFSSERAATAFVLAQAEPDRHARLKAHLEHLWGGGRCFVRRCASCGFGWADPYIAGDQEFYALATPDTAYPADRWEFGRTIEALDERLAAKDVDLLEIGSGRGHFLGQLIEKGWPPSRLCAIEYSEACRGSIERLGVYSQAKDVRRTPGAALFDVICMFHVLEHMDDLDDLFVTLARLLRPGGELFLAVPDAAWVKRNETMGLLFDMPPGHIGRWHISAFRAFSQRLGWYIIEHAAEPEPRLRAATQALAWRYLRRAQDGSLWPRLTCSLAERLPRRTKRLSKAAAALLDPPCWLASINVALSRGLAPSLWLHMRR